MPSQNSKIDAGDLLFEVQVAALGEHPGNEARRLRVRSCAQWFFHPLRFARDSEDVPDDLLIRRNNDGASEIVYRELDEPLVKLHIADLVTGP